MSGVQIVRADEFLVWLDTQGGSTVATNQQIAEALGLTVSASRIAEMIGGLASRGAIAVDRVAPHPRNNPAGRTIRSVGNEPF
jgi:hypothetical protein